MENDFFDPERHAEISMFFCSQIQVDGGECQICKIQFQTNKENYQFNN